MKRFFAAMLVAVFSFFVMRLFLGFEPWRFVDLYAAALIPLLSTLYVFAINGFKDSFRVFKVSFIANATTGELANALSFVKLLGKTYAYFSLFSTAVSLADMFMKWEDRTTIGPHLAVALVSIVYAIALWTLLILPMEGMIGKKIEKNHF
jgi:flagellar motor component MotA